jgi:tetratricopeptide (TPR) repeat protein
LSQEKIDASTYFTSTYPLDIRVPAISVNTAKILFDLSRFQEAAQLTQVVIDAAATAREAMSNNQKTATDKLLRTAVLISGHSRFELGEYELAEAAYRELLETDGADNNLRERLLASVFKQAEKSEASGDLQQTIVHFQRLSEIDRMSPLAIDASFDVAALYEQLGDAVSAIRQLEDFRRNYPGHPAVAEIPKRLVSLYETQNMPGSAASELLAMHGNQNIDRATQRQALYRAAELFLAADNTEMAIDSFRNYAHEYESPFGVRMEAMQHMDTLYQSKGESQKRRFWLRKKMDAFNRASPDQQDDRTRFLAADAAFILASDNLVQFEAARLNLPLKRSLKKKRKIMTKTVKAFEQVSDYGVAEFVSGSTFHVGSVYQSLAMSIIESDRPPNLNELELEQYEVLLEEQAFPFEEQAINIHKANLRQGWSIGWDDWVDASLKELDQLYPGRFRRSELGVAYVKSLY